LLLFGLQWYRKGIARVAARGLAGMSEIHVQAAHVTTGVDWTAFVLSFKGVLLEGMEIAIIVVSFGATAGQTGIAVIGAVAALVVIVLGLRGSGWLISNAISAWWLVPMLAIAMTGVSLWSTRTPRSRAREKLHPKPRRRSMVFVGSDQVAASWR